MTTELMTQMEAVKAITTAQPQVYTDNLASCRKCVKAGEELLMSIAEQGMTDELDQCTADYLTKTRRTAQKMYDRRASLTRLLDDVRKAFIDLENSIDPNRQETIAYKLQAFRNQYAAQKRMEEQERRAKEVAFATLRRDIAGDLQVQFQRVLGDRYSLLCANLETATIETDARETIIEGFRNTSEEFPADVFGAIRSHVQRPFAIPQDVYDTMEREEAEKLMVRYSTEYPETIRAAKEKALAALILIPNIDEESKQNILSDMETEGKRKEDELKMQTDAATLFDVQMAEADTYQPKVKVTYKIELLNAEGVMPILTTWWSKEGHNLSVEELAKMFKKQITYCERLANKESVRIDNESVLYVEQVVAK